MIVPQIFYLSYHVLPQFSPCEKNISSSFNHSFYGFQQYHDFSFSPLVLHTLILISLKRQHPELHIVLQIRSNHCEKQWNTTSCDLECMLLIKISSWGTFLKQQHHTIGSLGICTSEKQCFPHSVLIYFKTISLIYKYAFSHHVSFPEFYNLTCQYYFDLDPILIWTLSFQLLLQKHFFLNC